MEFDFNSKLIRQDIIESIIRDRLLPLSEYKSLGRELKLVRSEEDIINKCLDYGITVTHVPILSTEQKVSDIQNEYINKLNIIGVEVLPDIYMKNSFDDILVIREAALFRQSNGVIEMTLKDVNGVLHKNISVDVIVSTIVPLMSQRYAFLWETKEISLELVRNATTQEQVDAIVPDWTFVV